jgi:hypothetical protein
MLSHAGAIGLITGADRFRNRDQRPGAVSQPVFGGVALAVVVGFM